MYAHVDTGKMNAKLDNMETKGFLPSKMFEQNALCVVL